MAELNSLVISLDTELMASVVKATANTIARELRALTRAIEFDGSRWVDADALDNIISQLEKVGKVEK
jgi:hypothetical protein